MSETWRLEGIILGALCQVLFVLGITFLDYCLTTSLSLPQSLSPPPASGCSWVCPVGWGAHGVGSVRVLAKTVIRLKYDSKDPHRVVLGREVWAPRWGSPTPGVEAAPPAEPPRSWPACPGARLGMPPTGVQATGACQNPKRGMQGSRMLALWVLGKAT